MQVACCAGGLQCRWLAVQSASSAGGLQRRVLAVQVACNAGCLHCKPPALQATCTGSTLHCKQPALQAALIYLEFRQLRKVVFLLDIRLDKTELSAIAEMPVRLRTKTGQKHNFWQLPKVHCQSLYCLIHATLHRWFVVLHFFKNYTR
jgi:hypothetical protein